MRIKDGFEIRPFADGYAAVGLSGNMVISLNKTSALLWQAIAGGKTEKELAALLTDTYDVDELRAARDIEKFITTLKNADILID
ncbi:MAG: PqqD family protein [Clostridia bacterium]|nr:PqqD family protein [Clostridia bacterium]